MSYDMDLGGVERRIRELDSRVDQLESDNETTKGRLHGLVGDVEEVENRLDAAEETLEEGLADVRADLTRMRRQFNRHAQHIRWLDHHARGAIEVDCADLDATDDLTIELVKRTRAGNAAQREVDEVRAEAVPDVALLDRHQRLAQQAQKHTADALAATQVIEKTLPGSDSRARAVRVLDRARRAAAGTRAQLAELEDDVRVARGQLTLAREAEEARVATIDAGVTADQQLRARQRSRVIAAVARYERFPGWLVASIGHVPLDDYYDSWLDVVVDVVRYRLLHAVTDQHDPLGRRPLSADDARDREALRRRLDDFP